MAHKTFLITLFVAISFASFVLSLFVPIYTDEVVWKVLQGRMGYDHFHNIGALVSCKVHEIPTPLLLLPFHLIETAIYQDIPQPYLLRAIGGVLAIVWGLMTWVLLRRALKPTISSGTIALGIVAFSTLGVMPFLLVMNRPEQILLIAVTAFVIPLLGDPARPKRSLWADILLAFVLLICCGYVLASHPRALMTVPLMLLFVACFIGRKMIAGIVAIALFTIAKVALTDFGLRPLCMEPALRLQNIRDNIVLAMQQGELRYYLHSLAKELPHSDFFYLGQFQLSPLYVSDMFPRVPFWIEFPISAATKLSFALLLIFGVLSFLIAVREYFKSRKGLMPILALGSIWWIYAISMIARTTKANYEATLMEPLMAIAALASMWIIRDKIAAWLGATRSRRLAKAGFGFLLVLSTVNQVGLLATYIPYALGPWTDAGYTKGQKYSINGFGYSKLRQKILETAALCKIDPASHPKRLVVDELTYFAMEKANAPFFGTYIDENNWGSGIKDIRKELVRWRSDGMIAGCQWIPTPLRREATQNDAFCCLPAFRPAN